MEKGRTKRNPKTTLFERKRDLKRLAIQVQTSLPLTAGHRGRRQRGRERPATGSEAEDKGRQPRRAESPQGQVSRVEATIPHAN
jgi:hypothetical protein